MDSANKNDLEKQDFMKMSLVEIKESADKVISDRKKQTLSMEWLTDDYTITIEIKKNDHNTNDLLASEHMSEEERAVVQKLAEGKKQIQVAEELNISQAKVSLIKNKHAAVLKMLMASAIPVIGVGLKTFGTIKSVKK